MKEALDRGIPRSKTMDLAMSVSGFWGILGAIIAMFEAENVANAPKVIGISAGVENWETNNKMIRAVTDAGVAAIRALIK